MSSIPPSEQEDCEILLQTGGSRGRPAQGLKPGGPEVNGCTGELVALAAPSSSSGPCAAVRQEEVQGLPALSSQGEGLLGHLRS